MPFPNGTGHRKNASARNEKGSCKSPQMDLNQKLAPFRSFRSIRWNWISLPLDESYHDSRLGGSARERSKFNFSSVDLNNRGPIATNGFVYSLCFLASYSCWSIVGLRLGTGSRVFGDRRVGQGSIVENVQTEVTRPRVAALLFGLMLVRIDSYQWRQLNGDEIRRGSFAETVFASRDCQRGVIEGNCESN